LLDDPLSCVDASVGRHISEQVIHGLLKPKCVILATHLTTHAQCSSEVILLDKGTILARGTYKELSKMGLIATTRTDKVDDMTNEHDETEGTQKGVPAYPAEPASRPQRRTEGTVGLDVAWKFFRVGNGLALVVMSMGLCLLNQAVLTYADFYIKTWLVTDSNNQN